MEWDGEKHPQLGFGTYRVGAVPPGASHNPNARLQTPEEGVACVRQALELGYRWLDCAHFYANEGLVGEAIRQSGVPRDQLFLASKVWTDAIWGGAEAIRAQLDQTLQNLGTPYLDLYIVHWPVPGKHVQAWKALEALSKEGKVKRLGLSNYTIEDYEELRPHITIAPWVNQLEISPFLFRRKTLAYFQQQGIKLEAYRAFAQGKGMDNPVVARIAAAHSVTPAQVLGRWCVQRGFALIAKSSSKQRMQENARVLDFSLSDAEMGELDSLTPPEAYARFLEVYGKCVVRDTPLQPTERKVTVE